MRVDAKFRFGKRDLKNINNHHVDVLCSLCGSICFGEEFKPSRKRVALRDGPHDQFERSWFIPVILKDTSEVKIFIICTHDTTHSFLNDDVNVSLLLRQYRFVPRARSVICTY